MTENWFSWDECFSKFLSLFEISVPGYPHGKEKSFSLHLVRTSFVCNYACCLSLFCHAQLRRVCLCPLDNFLVATGCFLPTLPIAFPLVGWTCTGSLSFQHKGSAPAPLWPWRLCGPFYPCLLALWCQTWTPYSGYGLMSAEPRGAVTSLALWVGLQFLQPWRLLPFLGVCWLSLSWLSVLQNSLYIFCRAVVNQSVPSLYHCKGLFLPWYTAAFALLIFMCLLSACFFSLPRSHWMGSTLTYINLLLSF